MVVLKWLWEGSGNGLVKPSVVFWTLRAIMFILSFVLEDWAVHELIDSPRERRLAVLLVASSYVTWTWQVHTFSNAIETLVVLWSLVLIRRMIRDTGIRSSIWGSCVLALLVVFGTFNRITFPAYLAVPALQLLTTFRRRPSTLFLLASFGAAFALLAIFVDTVFYHPKDTSISELLGNLVIAPLNSLRYNSKAANLALHGTHPFYQHLVVNLPQLLGPALPLIFSARRTINLASALSGVAILSYFSHQEARFLLPAVPLILSSISIPKGFAKPFLVIWIVFNVILGSLMGVYHQGGVMPAQMWLGTQEGISQAFWWKTYSPPIWLLNGRSDDMSTIDLMGMNSGSLVHTICTNKDAGAGERVLVAPASATFLDQFKGVTDSKAKPPAMRLKELWSHRKHINLDDMDIGDDGVWETWSRVVGRRGLKVWTVECPLSAHAYTAMGQDGL